MIIGLTGGTASGKTTVSKNLHGMGIRVIDADIIAKRISKDIIFQKEILSHFNTLDRKEIKNIVFNDKTQLKTLNDIFMNKIKYIFKVYAEKYKNELVIFDVPLLFESGIDKYCDKTIVVCVDRNIQIQRMMIRDNIDEELAINIIDSQMKQSEKIKKADITIWNNRSILVLYNGIVKLRKAIEGWI